ncbi:hypothetical protein PR048_025803 [Dryococelus australis]|uniref:Uncharacterized protein n=1 Tax=Dryococelus australis TaxID=614101 RepID=A0ABQ9GJJ2_9NEOP|nr:hypothetical protein PR048_025803 [Dryococelus australis]
MNLLTGRGDRAVRLLASHQSEPGSISGRATTDFRKWESCRTMPLVGRRVSSEISRFTLPCIPALLHFHLISPTSALKTSLLRAAQISPYSNTLHEAEKCHASRPLSACTRQRNVMQVDLSACTRQRNVMQVDLYQGFKNHQPQVVAGYSLPMWGHFSRGEVAPHWQRSQVGRNLIFHFPKATMAEWLDCSPPIKAGRVQFPAVSLRIFATGNRARRCRWPTDFLGDLPFPLHFHSGSAPYSLHFTSRMEFFYIGNGLWGPAVPKLEGVMDSTPLICIPSIFYLSPIGRGSLEGVFLCFLFRMWDGLLRVISAKDSVSVVAGDSVEGKLAPSLGQDAGVPLAAAVALADLLEVLELGGLLRRRPCSLRDGVPRHGLASLLAQRRAQVVLDLGLCQQLLEHLRHLHVVFGRRLDEAVLPVDRND